MERSDLVQKSGMARVCWETVPPSCPVVAGETVFVPEGPLLPPISSWLQSLSLPHGARPMLGLREQVNSAVAQILFLGIILVRGRGNYSRRYASSIAFK